jgi:hypothetical protein
MLKDVLISASSYGIWDIINFLILLVGSLYGYFRFFRPRPSIPNFSISFTYNRDSRAGFPLQLSFNFANRTGKSAFITAAWFTCKKFRPDPNADCDGKTGKMLINFPRQHSGHEGRVIFQLSAGEHYLKDGESVSTYIPLDQKHTDEEVKANLQAGNSGVLECFIILLSPDIKPMPYKLRVCPKRDYGLPCRSLIGR